VRLVVSLLSSAVILGGCAAPLPDPRGEELLLLAVSELPAVARAMGVEAPSVTIRVDSRCPTLGATRGTSIRVSEEALLRPDLSLTVAHELAHACCRGTRWDGLPPQVEEGVAWWVSALATGRAGEVGSLSEPSSEELLEVLTAREQRPELDQAAVWLGARLVGRGRAQEGPAGPPGREFQQ